MTFASVSMEWNMLHELAMALTCGNVWQEENEQLQLRLASVSDEYESRKEEFAFLESKIQVQILKPQLL